MLFLVILCFISVILIVFFFFFFFQAEDGIRDFHVTGVQTCALPIFGLTSMETRLRTISATTTGCEQIPGAPEQFTLMPMTSDGRSEERRVGKECRSRWSREK